ncbi:MAG TPA: GNAT family N-acetyltransferase [Nocardioidaceae bacterium]|jgi:ribosomal protein S18 acetylase RimI-like enzyme
MSLRPFRPDDLDDLIALTIDTFGPFFEQSFRSIVGHRIFTHQHGDWQEEYRRDLPRLHDPEQHKHVVVSVTAGTIAGFVAWSVEPEKHRGTIHYLAVDKDHRRQGVASALYEAATAAMRRTGVQVVSLGTGGEWFHEPARAFYESKGMIPVPNVSYFQEL